VDGSHIRTLLLTFFYRQMPELIEKGYLYIAQPPLFKVGKGKNEIYIKNESDYNDYLLKRICEQKAVRLGEEGTLLSGADLYLFAGNLTEYDATLGKLELAGLPSELVELLIREDVSDKHALQDPERIQRLENSLVQNGYRVENRGWEEAKGVYELTVIPSQDRVTKDIKAVRIGRSMIYSKDYQKSMLLGKQMLPLDRPPFAVIDRETEKEAAKFNDKRELLSYFMAEGKKGISVQRYKGLGEMNPGQLWETTMNPEKRMLLQVRVEDAVGATEIFSILMGDEVEPRRSFIENNALEVSMLDI